MRFSTALSLALILPALHLVSAGPHHRHRQADGKGGRSRPKPSSVSTPVPSPATSPAAAVKSPVVLANGDNNGGGNNGGNNNGGNNNNGNNNGGDIVGDLCVSPTVIGPALAETGQDPNNLTPGQVESLTSTNNYIDFCLDKTITNGQQIQAGSCNPVPMGDIPSVDNMPSCKFVNPPNGGQVTANKVFTVKLAVQNLKTGQFTNPNKNYFAAPQQLEGGIIKGHSHVTIQKLGQDQTSPLNSKSFDFFKGLNDPAVGNILQTDVTNGLPAGVYRMCSINAAANHQGVLGPVAQRGSLDDCVQFESVDNGGNNNGGNAPAPASGAVNNGGNNGGNKTTPANGGGNNGGGNGGNGKPPANNATNTGGNNGGNDKPPANGGGKDKPPANGGGNNGGNNKPSPSPANRAANPSPTPSSSPSPSPSPSNGGGGGGKKNDGGRRDEKYEGRRDVK